MADCDPLVSMVLEEHGHVDVLINNAGRSIRRSIESSYDRFHDFERTMQLNYFGSLRLIMGFLPTMTHAQGPHHQHHLDRRAGQLAALLGLRRVEGRAGRVEPLRAGRVCRAGITFTTINMPLVKTPMIAPTKMYESVPTLTPEEAADLMVKAIIERPGRIATRLGIFGQVLNAVAPKVTKW